MRLRMSGTVPFPARPRPGWLRVAGAAAAGGVALMLVAGCTSNSGVSASSSAALVPAAPAAAQGGVAAGVVPGPAAGGTGAATGPRSDATVGKAGAPAGVQVQFDVGDRQVIKTATVTMDVVVRSDNAGAAADLKKEQQAVDDAYVRVTAIPTGAGYVSAVNGGGTTVSITLRVPAAAFDSVLQQLAAIAPVVQRQVSTEDVTSQMVDLESRIQTLKASVAQGRVLLSKADKIGDVIAIESEVNQREADLESLQRQQAALAGQTSLSSITAVLRGSVSGVKNVPPPVPPTARSGFIGGLTNGWHAVRHLGNAVLTVLGTLIPFLPILAVLAGGLLYWHRRIRRGVRAVPAAQPGDPQPLG